MIETTWSEIKRIADSKGLPVQWVQAGNNYHVCLVDGPFKLFCLLSLSSNDDTDVFEASYKAGGNKRVDVAAPSFSSKTVGTKKIYARTTGMQFSLSAGANTCTYTATYPWAKITGVEILGGETGDQVDFKVKDTPAGTYSTIPNHLLNQFGFSVNIAKDFYKREATFDADLYVGMVLEFTYTSVSAKTVGLNLIMAEVK